MKLIRLRKNYLKMNNFLNVSCFQTNSSENPSKNIEMLSKMFEKNKKGDKSDKD